MANNSRTLSIILDLQDRMSRQLDNVTKNLSPFQKGIMKIGPAIAAAFSVSAISNFAQVSLQAAQDQQLSNEKLANALSNVAGSRQEDLEMLLEQASALQRVTAIGDEQIINNQALLATFQLEADSIAKLIPRILDMGAANAKTGELTTDLESSTLAVGKALTNGIGSLSRYGVAMTEAQKQAFDLANEQEKVNILAEVLDQNFAGAAETVGNTFAGRVARAKNAIGDLNEGIGFALIPTIEAMLSGIIGNTEAVAENNEWVNTLAKTIYRIANIFIATTKSVKLVITTMVALGDTLISAVRISFAFSKDFITAFFNIRDSVIPILKGIAKVLTGDVSGGLEEMKSAVQSTFSSTIGEMDRMKHNTEGWAGEISDVYSSLGESMLKGIDLEGFKPVSAASIKAGKAVMQSAEQMSEGAGKAGNDIEKLKEKYQDFQEDASKALIDLQNDHQKSLQSIRDEIKRTTQEISDLQESYAQEKKSDVQRIAEEVVRTEERVADIQAQLAKETNAERRAQLMAELSEQQMALQNNRGFIENIEDAVLEARRRAGLTDLERAIEDFNIKRELAEKEFQTKMTHLQDELKALRNKEKEEIEGYKNKLATIVAIQQIASEKYAEAMKREFAITKEKIENEIRLYQELAKAIAKVRNGKASDLSGVQSRVSAISPNFNVNVNVSGSVIAERDLANTVGNLVMNKMRLNQALPL